MLDKEKEVVEGSWWDEDLERASGRTSGEAAESGGTAKERKGTRGEDAVRRCPLSSCDVDTKRRSGSSRVRRLLVRACCVADPAFQEPPLDTTLSFLIALESPPTPTASPTPSSPSDSSPLPSLGRRRSTSSHLRRFSSLPPERTASTFSRRCQYRGEITRWK